MADSDSTGSNKRKRRLMLFIIFPAVIVFGGIGVVFAFTEESAEDSDGGMSHLEDLDESHEGNYDDDDYDGDSHKGEGESHDDDDDADSHDADSHEDDSHEGDGGSYEGAHRDSDQDEFYEKIGEKFKLGALAKLLASSLDEIFEEMPGGPALLDLIEQEGGDLEDLIYALTEKFDGDFEEDSEGHEDDDD